MILRSDTDVKALRRIIALLLLAAACVLLISCSSDNEQEEESAPAPGWDYFEAFNPIGQSYSTISGKYHSLDDSGVYDGGVVLKADNKDLYFGFPRFSKEEIENSDICTSVYGTLGTVFGLTKSYASDDLEELLSIKWEQDYDDMFYANAERPGGSYTVLLVVDNINELYGPETSITIFQNNAAGEETD